MSDVRTVGDGSFSLGSRTWPGLSKVVEEAGEVLTEAGKLIGTAGAIEHWDGKGPLDERLANEMVDLFAALRACFQLNGFDGREDLMAREQRKYELFLTWHVDGLPDEEDQITVEEPVWNVPTAIEQIEKCEFECEGGPLANNVAWQWLKGRLLEVGRFRL